MSTFWIATIGASISCYLLKLLGYIVPESFLNKPRFERINALIPVVLLSSLVAVQTLSSTQKVTIDHRLAGVAAAAFALKLRLSFPIMMLVATLTSAFIYRLG